MTTLTNLLKQLDLLQQAYIWDEETYVALAEHKDTKEEYEVTWEITCHDTDDESNACDWENPLFITKL